MAQAIGSFSTPASRFGSSRPAKVAALAMLALGASVAAAGLILIGQGLTYDDAGNMGYGWLAGLIGSVVVVVGLVHLVDGVSIWRHGGWARIVGIVIGACGALLCALLLPTAFNPVHVVRNGDEIVQAPAAVSSMLLGLMVVPYVVVLLGLILGGRHFHRDNG